jgi:hypothetical protein
MELKDDLVEFLTKSREVLELNFEIFDLRFSPGQYGIIADRIKKGQIGVSNSSLLPMSKGAGASWKYLLNSFWFRPEMDFENYVWRAIMAHEATHCVHDLLNPGKVATSVVESIGYLAEAFARHAQGRGPIMQDANAGIIDPMRAEAMRVVKANCVTDGTQAKIKTADAESLQKVVAAHPHTISQGETMEYMGVER